jgi:hypothetical protein
MPNHFQCVGIPAGDKEELKDFIMRAVQSAASFDVPEGGSLLEWQDPSGASLYMHLDHENSIQCIAPSFSGTFPHRVVPKKTVPDSGCSFCDALYVEVVDDKSQMFYPLVLQLEDIEIARPKIAFGSQAIARVTAFAERLEVWPEEKAFEESQAKDDKADTEAKVRFGPEFFVPSGTFNDPATANALFRGKVIEVERPTNSESGSQFLHMAVKSFGGTYDVVAPLQQQEIKPGAIVECDCWMIGRLL